VEIVRRRARGSLRREQVRPKTRGMKREVLAGPTNREGHRVKGKNEKIDMEGSTEGGPGKKIHIRGRARGVAEKRENHRP